MNQLLDSNPASDKETDQIAWAIHMNHILAIAKEISEKCLMHAMQVMVIKRI